MMSMAQPFSPHPGGMQGHPGMPQSHPMASGHPSHQGNGPPGPGIPQQIHMVSGPGGPQVSQGGPIMGGMPPGGGMPSGHAMSHLSLSNPQQMYAQQQQQHQMVPGFAPGNPQMMPNQHFQQQQQLVAARRQQQLAMQQGQYPGSIPMMANGMPASMSPAQLAAFRAGQNPQLRPVNLTQHLQQQQQQVNMGIDPQAQHHHNQQLLMQQMAMQQQQHANQAQANHQGQPGQIGQHQLQAQMAAQQAHAAQQQQQQQHAQQQQQQQQAAQAAAANQNQQQQQQAQPQQSQSQAQQQPSQQQQQAAQQQQFQQQAAQQHAQHIQQQRQAFSMQKPQGGHVILRLFSLSDGICQFQSVTKSVESYMGNGISLPAARSMKQQSDLAYWQNTVVDKFFSPSGVLKYSALDAKDSSTKAYEIPYLALARYFNTHFEGGIKNIQLQLETPEAMPLPNGRYWVNVHKASFVYWFENGTHVVANGKLSVQYDENHKIDFLDFTTQGYEEYLKRSHVVELARPLHEWQKEWHKVNGDARQSPEMNKKGKARQMKSPPTQPPDIDYPETRLKGLVLTQSVSQFLEIAEVMSQMNPLFQYHFQNPSLTPYAALDQYMANVQAASNNPTSNANHQSTGPNGGGQRTPGPGMPQFPMGAGVSPASGHLTLPGGSPHIGGSPGQIHMQAPGMALQASQQGTSSSGPSANTSPNVSNKRRRPSGVKIDEDSGPPQVNGTGGGGNNAQKVKQSPRVGNKRQKGTAS